MIRKHLRFSLFVMIFFILCLSFTGCKRPLVKEHVFTNQTWQKFDTIVFNIPSSGDNKPYNIRLFIHYLGAFPTFDLPIVAIMQSPTGEERFFTKRIWLKSLDGKPKGVEADDHFVLEQVLWHEFVFKEKGVYRLIIESDHPNYQVEGIISVKIEILPGALEPPKPQPGNFNSL